MGSLNKVFLLGNLTREPELRYTPGGSAVGEFGLAVNRKFNDKEETCFVDIVVWGKQAETCSRYLEKGVSVLIEGRLQLDQWQDKESGARRSRLRVVAERVQFLGRGGERGPDGSYPPEDAGEYDGGYQQEPSQAAPQPARQQQYRQAPQEGQSYGGGNYRQAPQDGQHGGYRQAPPEGQYRQAAPRSQAAAPQRQQQQPPPPPMPPEGAFDVDSAEDDIPF